MVFMCGTDLESNYSMATKDLQEMANAEIDIRSFIGVDPKPVDAEETLMLCACLREKLAEMASHDESFHPDASEIDMAERYFSKKVYGD